MRPGAAPPAGAAEGRAALGTGGFAPTLGGAPGFAPTTGGFGFVPTGGGAAFPAPSALAGRELPGESSPALLTFFFHGAADPFAGPIPGNTDTGFACTSATLAPALTGALGGGGLRGGGGGAACTAAGGTSSR